MSLNALEPDEVVALHYDNPAVAAELAAWCHGEVMGEVIAVPTPRGAEFAAVGDWIVRAADGHFRPYEPAEFGFHFAPA